MSQKEKYILYGASFNPPHIGHFSDLYKMLEEYDKVIVFPYPKKFINGNFEELPPVSQRMKMLEIFVADFFPQMSERLIIINLSSEINSSNFKKDFLHTYDYLQFIKSRLPESIDLSVCIGFENKNNQKLIINNEQKIKEEFNTFYLTEENKIKSKDLRTFFSKTKNIKSRKEEDYVISSVGYSLAYHIFKYNLYGVKNKKIKLNK